MRISDWSSDVCSSDLRGVTLSANYAYTRAAYDEYKLVSGAAVKQLDCSGSYQPQGATIDLSCAPFLYTPRHQFSVTAIYDLPVDANLGGISGSITYAWTDRSEEHTSELQSLMRISYAVFCLKKKNTL